MERTSLPHTPAKKTLSALDQLGRYWLEDLLDDAYGVSCYDEQGDDDLRKLVERGLRSGAIREEDVVERADM